MRFLFLTSNLPYPPTDGWKIRVFAFLRHLSQRHRVSVVSFMRTTEDVYAIAALRKHCVEVRVVPRDPRYSPWKLFLGLISPTAFPVLNYRDTRMGELVRSMLAKHPFDIVQAESLEMAQYCLELPHTTILDLHNIESLLMKRYSGHACDPLKRTYAQVTWRKLATYEREVCGHFTHCLTCSEVDQHLLRQQTGIERVSVVPNGVDLEAFTAQDVHPSSNNRLVFVGRMDYHANVDGVRWFCTEVLPLVRAGRPDVLFQIVGGHPTEDVRRLARPSQVEVTGFVEDVRPYLSGSTVVVAPLRIGGGTRLKILEAMAMRKVVISTRIGAEGIKAIPEKEILIGDSPAEFAGQILRTLDNPDLRMQVGTAGQRLVEAYYSWKSIGQRLEEVYEEAVR